MKTKIYLFTLCLSFPFLKAQHNTYIKQDTSILKYGLVNSEGIWISEPYFNTLQKLNNYFFYGEKEGLSYIYRYDTDSKKLLRINYQLFDTKIYNNNFIIIQQSTNGQKGIMDIKGNIILPTFYSNIWIEENYFIGEIDNQVFLYENKGNKLLNRPFKHIEVKNSLIYAKSDDTRFSSKEKTTVYSSSLEPITKENWTAIGKFGKDNLLLIKTIDNQLFYIDTLGEIKIKPNSQLIYQYPFSNGFAVVSSSKDKKKYGFIDTSGKLIIPTEYKEAGPFQTQYAFFSREENGQLIEGLIDNKNKIIKLFPKKVTSRSIYYDGNEVTYYLSNLETYDADGNFKEDKNLIQ